MPEGDTIFRTAESLRRWIGGRRVSAARSPRLRADLTAVVGAKVESVDARAKHLLIRFDNGRVLHTHMRMTGSWHVYPSEERWRKPAAQAVAVLECGARLAVCFNAPVVELLTAAGERSLPALVRLGPDVLGSQPVEAAELLRRAADRAHVSPTVGELLLDQQFVSGIGNIYRCETLFLCRADPHLPTTSAAGGLLGELVATASRLMRVNAEGSPIARRFDSAPERPWVYGRSGRPCSRCGSVVVRELLGDQGRGLYWCPGCQVRRA